MAHNLSDLIAKHTGGSGIPAAEFSSTNYGAKNKFNVSTGKYGSFISGYCELVTENERNYDGYNLPEIKLGLSEVVGSKATIPLMGFFRFCFDVREGEEERSYYCEDLPMRIIKCYQQAMSELLDISSSMSEYLCCLMESHSYRKGSEVRIDMRIQFPFCQVDARYLKKTFRQHVTKLLRSNKVKEAFEEPVIGDWDKIIIDADNFIAMYGSSTDPNIPSPRLTHIYGMIEDKHIEDSCGDDLELHNVFNPGVHSFIYSGKISKSTINLEPEDMDEIDEFCKNLLPLFLSIHFWSGETHPLETTDASDNGGVRKGVYDIEELESDDPMRIAVALLPLLSPERANKDYSWLDVGRVLHNITKGSQEGLAMWISFSSRATVAGRDKGMCTFRYSEFRPNGLLTVKTLAWYAKIDNPSGYQDWHFSWCQKTLNDGLTATHADVAKAIYRIFWLEYIYSVDTENWYEYRENHFYRLGKQCIPLRKSILEKFLKIYEKMRVDMSVSSLEKKAEDPGKREVDYKIDALQGLTNKLKNENYLSTIVKAAKVMFSVEEFEKNCDKNHYFTAVANCVLEVVDKKVRPRPGKPEDYITKFSLIYYPFEYNWDSYWVKEMLYWMDQITVRHADFKHYFLKRLASFLRGLNPEKLFDVWTNSGNNSKSMLMKVMQTIFGSYFIDFPTALLTSGNGKNSSGPSPELAQAANARGAFLAEPDDRESMKGGIIKRITGGDRIFTRALNENGGSMDITFKTIMVCNRIPDIANVDRALINRFVVMPFLGTWCEDAPESEEEQFRQRKFKMDINFESRIPELSRGLLWIMVQYYSYYAEEGLAFPVVVKEYIEKHWADNDHYLQFIAEKIEYAFKDADRKEYDLNVTLSVQEIYPIFGRWFRDYYPGVSPPTAAQFRSDMEMSGRLGPQPKRGLWLGIRIKQSALVPDLGGIKI